MPVDQLQNVAFALAVVLACVYALSLVAKRLRQGHSAKAGDCHIISSTFVGPKERVVLLKVRDKELLIGIGPTHMCALGEFQVEGETTACSPEQS